MMSLYFDWLKVHKKLVIALASDSGWGWEGGEKDIVFLEFLRKKKETGKIRERHKERMW